MKRQKYYMCSLPFNKFIKEKSHSRPSIDFFFYKKNNIIFWIVIKEKKILFHKEYYIWVYRFKKNSKITHLFILKNSF